MTAIGHRRRLTWHLAALLLVLGLWGQFAVSLMPDTRDRTFFGIYTVRDTLTARRLTNGTTLHGVQSRTPGAELRPTSYYAPGSGAGRAFAAVPRVFGPGARVGFVGLGAGTLACYARAGQVWTAFEIDPAMVGVARDRFSYVRRCKPDLRIVLGDARLELAAVPAGAFDVLAIDAFSSDAIPLHLMTREAFARYARALAPGGILLVHISNRYLALEPVVAALAADGGWTARTRDFTPSRGEAKLGDTRSTWVALARSPAAIAALTAPGGWRPVRAEAGVPAWSDDFASVLPMMKAFRPTPPVAARN